MTTSVWAVPDTERLGGQWLYRFPWKEAVLACATGNVDISNLNAGDTLDGVTLATYDRVLLPAQTTASQCGIYVVGATAGTSYRSGDMSTTGDFAGAHVWVRQGSTYTGTLWRCTNTSPPTVDTTSITFARVYDAVTDHGALTGLGDDDHPQYATNAEFDDHSARHESAGADAIKLDDLATPDDNTDLNASTTRHGLLPKLSGDSGQVLRGDGTFGAITSGGMGPLLLSSDHGGPIVFTDILQASDYDDLLYASEAG